jgi:hypothetical protein
MSLGQDDTMQGVGCGRGCAGAAGPRYQWVQGVDGLGSPFGFWKRIKRLAKRALPIVQRIAPFVPGGAAALTAATPFLKHAGIAGLGDVGALYAAPDGSLYQVQGVDDADSIDGFADDDLNGFADDELQGFADDDLNGMSDDELRGLAADDELSGYGEGEDLNGFAAGDELYGIGAEPDLSGFAAMDPLDGIDADELNGYAADDLDGFADDELNGFADDERMSGYVRDGRINGIEGYRPDGPPTTPAFSPAPNAPMWAPLW